MVSSDSKMRQDRPIPVLALTWLELRTLFHSWLVRVWLAAAILLSFVTVLGGWRVLPLPVMIASLAFPFLVFPWFVVIVILGTNAVVASRMDSVADGILSRPITRLEFLVAAWLARAITVLAVFVLAVVPAALVAGLADRPVESDPVATYGVFVASLVVGLVLLGVLSLGFFAGVLLRNSWLALLVVLFVWYPANLLFTTFRLEELSPVSLNQALPTLMRKTWETAKTESDIRPMDLIVLQQQADQFIQSLTGRPRRPAREPAFFEHDLEYQDIRPWRVVLSYAIPIVVFLGLSYVCFYFRDL